METPVYMMLFISILRMQVSKASFSCPQSAPTICYVNSCPQNKTEWDHAAERKKCNLMAAHQNCTDAAKFQYHCLLNHHRNATLEVCAPVFFLQGFCASYNTERIDIVENYEPGFECLTFSGDDRCPPRYPSSEAYKYLKCYGSHHEAKTTTTTATLTNTSSARNDRPDTGGSGAGAVVAVIVVLIICIIVVILVVFYRRNQFGFKSRMQPYIEVFTACLQEPEGGISFEDSYIKTEEEQEKEKTALLSEEEQEKEKTALLSEEKEKQISKLKSLLKYLVHILKREVDVKDLKEKIVIHSKSIEGSYLAPFRSALRGVQSSDDYSRLNISVVFTLLQSFCTNIKPPSKGWDHVPPSDEMTVEADIERIRLMWNSFCDDCKEFPQLDDVYKRMIQRFGTVVVQEDDRAKEFQSGEDVFELKDKILSITLYPDCNIEKGIVITDSIASARKRIQEKNVVILKGAIGCGKTYALKAIQNHFEDHWNTSWIQEEELLTTDKFPAKSILLCDNFCGQLGCHAFSKCYIEQFEKYIKDIESDQSENLKVVIAIHQHVFEEVKKSCPLNFLQNKNLSIDMDRLTDAETLLIFKEQRKEGHCKGNPGCWFEYIEFSSVLSKLSKSHGQVGSPFLSLMYCYFHDLFSDDDFTKKPVQSLLKRLNTMRKDFYKDYFCLVYLMCVQNQELDKDLETWAGLIDAEISLKAIDNLNKRKPGYIQIEQKNATLKHDVLAIAVFKSVAEVKEHFLPVVQKCRVPILLELMRPSVESHCEFYTHLVNTRKREEFREVGKTLVNRLAQTCGKNLKHPLRSEELFKEEYERNSTRT